MERADRQPTLSKANGLERSGPSTTSRMVAAPMKVPINTEISRTGAIWRSGAINIKGAYLQKMAEMKG
jgi:hypothetical protein